MKTKIVSSHTADSKPVKQEINGTVMLPPLVFPAWEWRMTLRWKGLPRTNILAYFAPSSVTVKTVFLILRPGFQTRSAGSSEKVSTIGLTQRKKERKKEIKEERFLLSCFWVVQFQRQLIPGDNLWIILTNSETKYFGNQYTKFFENFTSFCQPVILSTCHFVNLSFCELVILWTCHFVNLSFCQLVILSTCYFVNCQKECLTYLT